MPHETGFACFAVAPWDAWPPASAPSSPGSSGGAGADFICTPAFVSRPSQDFLGAPTLPTARLPRGHFSGS